MSLRKEVTFDNRRHLSRQHRQKIVDVLNPLRNAKSRQIKFLKSLASLSVPSRILFVHQTRKRYAESLLTEGAQSKIKKSLCVPVLRYEGCFGFFFLKTKYLGLLSVFEQKNYLKIGVVVVVIYL
jgi:hypothetical protein